MAIIASALSAIKSDPLACVGGADRVNACFARAGHVWRDRLLDPAHTLALFVLQILHCNTAISHLRHLSDLDVADSSYCEARARLPVAGVAAVAADASCDGRIDNQDGMWLGRRVLMADATAVTAPDTPELQELWPQVSAQKKGCGFPAIKLLALLNLASGMITHLTVVCLKVHEMSQLAGLHAGLCRGDVLLADRAFCSF